MNTPNNDWARMASALQTILTRSMLLLMTLAVSQFTTQSAAARDGAPRVSAYEIYSDPLFSFSAPRITSLADSDCMTEEDAKTIFNNLGQPTILTGPASNNFLTKAYAGKLGFAGRLANVDHVAVVAEGTEKFQVFLGSDKILLGKTIYCGFGRPQYLNREWAEAGIQNKTLHEQLPELTTWQQTVSKLSSAYAGMDYTRVRSSLISRGFKAVAQPNKPVDRCAPGLEQICFQYNEADCNADASVSFTCAFEWKSADDESLGIIADVRQLGGGDDEVDVIGALDLTPSQPDDKGEVGSSNR